MRGIALSSPGSRLDACSAQLCSEECTRLCVEWIVAMAKHRVEVRLALEKECKWDRRGERIEKR